MDPQGSLQRIWNPYEKQNKDWTAQQQKLIDGSKEVAEKGNQNNEGAGRWKLQGKQSIVKTLLLQGGVVAGNMNGLKTSLNKFEEGKAANCY